MRYENWDVLLFPEGSKVPLPEFKTQCFAARDLDSPYLHNQLLDNPASFYQSVNAHGGPGQVPVLTTFIPSMARGNPFRVSVHSWDRPTPTKVMEGLMQPEDSVMYEVRVFIDGYCISGSLFNSRAPWPHVIDFSSQVDKSGNQDLLRFPPFHEEILRHVRWDASEVYGRIRVIIAEGFTRPHRSPPFERVRDVIIFSFQHAPLHILEQSNIAWPNPGMWQQDPRPFVKYAAEHEASHAKDDEAHSHSPTRHGFQRIGAHDGLPAPSYSMWPYRLYPTPSFPRQATPWPERGTGWEPTPHTSDPFVEAFRAPVQNRRNRSTLSDVPMPDYIGSTSTSSRAISGNTGSSLGRNKEPAAPAPIDDEQYNQLIQALSPPKKSSGTSAPANTPTTTRPAATKSPEPEPRAASHSRKGSRRGPLRELSQASSRVPSNASLESRGSEDNSPPPVVLLTPSGHVTGRKERRSSRGNSSGGASISSKPSSGKRKPASPAGQQENQKSSESKRKRQMSSMDASVAGSIGSTSASPTKKISRRMEEGDQPQDMIETLLEATSGAFTGGSDLQDE